MKQLTYNRIKEFLAKYRKTNIQLAEYVGRHEQTVSGWCTNNSQPDIGTLFKIADFLNVEASELLTPRKDLVPVSEVAKGSKKANKKKTIKKK